MVTGSSRLEPELLLPSENRGVLTPPCPLIHPKDSPPGSPLLHRSKVWTSTGGTYLSGWNSPLTGTSPTGGRRVGVAGRSPGSSSLPTSPAHARGSFREQDSCDDFRLGKLDSTGRKVLYFISDRDGDRLINGGNFFDVVYLLGSFRKRPPTRVAENLRA